MIEPINIDADPFNADWPKRTWNLGVEDEAQLRAFLAMDGVTLAGFKTRPAYLLAVRNPDHPAWLDDLPDK